MNMIEHFNTHTHTFTYITKEKHISSSELIKLAVILTN